jgi:6-pyruvoyl-tetrahydropterin synthase
MTTKNPTTKEKNLIKKIYDLVQANVKTDTRFIAAHYVPAHLETYGSVPPEYRIDYPSAGRWVPGHEVEARVENRGNVFAYKSSVEDFQKVAKSVAKLVNANKKQRHRTHEALVEIAESLEQRPEDFDSARELWATFKYAVAEGFNTLYPTDSVAAIVNEQKPAVKNPFLKKK